MRCVGYRRRMHNPRTPDVEVDPMFVDRWSPRSFASDPLSTAQLQSLFEAARWAPSSANEQPWRFFYAVSDDDRQRFASALVEGNRLWASQAPVLLFVTCRRHWAAKPGQVNPTASFDTGAAWMSIALQARKLGLYTHAMAGFDAKRAYEVLGLPETEYQVIAAVAVGQRGDATALPDFLASREMPSNRKAVTELAFEGGYHAETTTDAATGGA